MNWTFPETIFVKKNTTREQIGHFLSEAVEVAIASSEECRPEFDIEKAADKERAVEVEMADALHSAETYLRRLAKDKGEAYVVSLIESVINKNRVRGYYQEKSDAV